MGTRREEGPVVRGRASQRGFSLTELLIVIVIIGILAAIAIPIYLSQRDKAKEAALQSTAHYVLIAAADYAASGLTIEPYHASDNGSSSEALNARTYVSNALEVSIKRALGPGREGWYANPYSGERTVLNTSISYLTSAGYRASVPPAVFITNEPRCRYGSIQDAANGSFRNLLKGAVVACWNNQHAVRAIEVYSIDGDGVRSATVSRVPFD
jgi:prepilin-type N-terminal cleavage/methylation domain-containing protein